MNRADCLLASVCARSRELACDGCWVAIGLAKEEQDRAMRQYLVAVQGDPYNSETISNPPRGRPADGYPGI